MTGVNIYMDFIIKVHPRASMRSFITKPLSAMTLSPLSSNYNERIPDCLEISFSDMPPVYNWDTKVTLPEGAIPNSALAVLVLLYCEKTWDCLNKEEGVWILNSVASRITLVEGNFPKQSGIVSWITCFGNQKLIDPQHKMKQIDPWCEYPWNCGTRNVE